MTLQQLRYIVAIAEAGTFSGAAKKTIYYPAQSDEDRPGAGAGNEYPDF